MGDASIKGRGMLGRMGRSAPRTKKTQEERDEDYAALGRYVTGIEGKPHSNIEGQKYAGARFLTRMWYGRGKKNKKGTEV